MFLTYIFLVKHHRSYLPEGFWWCDFVHCFAVFTLKAFFVMIRPWYAWWLMEWNLGSYQRLRNKKNQMRYYLKMPYQRRLQAILNSVFSHYKYFYQITSKSRIKQKAALFNEYISYMWLFFVEYKTAGEIYFLFLHTFIFMFFIFIKKLNNLFLQDVFLFK